MLCNNVSVICHLLDIHSRVANVVKKATQESEWPDTEVVEDVDVLFNAISSKTCKNPAVSALWLANLRIYFLKAIWKLDSLNSASVICSSAQPLG